VNNLGKAGRWALQLWAPLVMLALLPTLSNFLGNRFEVSVQDLVLPLILDVIVAAIIAGLFTWAWRRSRLGGYVSAILAMLALGGDYNSRLTGGYQWLQHLTGLPALDGWMGVVVSLIAVALTLAASYGLGRLASMAVKRTGWPERDLAIALSIAIAATFIFKAGPVAGDLAAEWPQFFYRPPQLTSSTAKTTAGKPDIYYIVLDRYASQDVLKQQFGFDNTDFISYLSVNGYYVNPSAHNNYPYTAMSIASTMTGNYLNDIVNKFGGSAQQTTIPFNESIRSSPVASELKSLGYRYDLIGNWYETSNTSRVADNVYQPTGRLTIWGYDFIINNFAKNSLTQSVIWRFLQPGIRLGSFTVFNYGNMGDVDLDHYALTQLASEAAGPPGGRFIFAHILIPHDPYYFNADGSLSANTDSDNEGKPLKQKYIGQVQYINIQMKSILSQINTVSQGQAVVVLQSDEGPYPIQLNDQDFDENDVEGELKVGDMRKWSDTNLQMKFGNLAAYHIPAANLGQAADTTTAADSVNVFRLVLNTYFGATLPYLPDCYYVYPNGRDQPERFSDITARLTGQAADARCQANGSVKQ